MAAPTPCPSRDELRALLQGMASDEQAASLETHLLYCESCLASLKALTEKDPLEAALSDDAQQPSPASAWPENAAERVLARLRPQLTYTALASGDTVAPTDDSEQDAPRTTFTGWRVFFDPPRSADEIGRLGPYRVVGVLGQGGMGTVFKAEDPRLGRTVAIKIPHAGGVATLATAMRTRFLREARVVAPIRHPNVCPIYDVGEHQGFPYVVMAYMEGGSLADLLDRAGALDFPSAVRIVRQIAGGLAALHANNAVHRDLKPANILLDEAGNAVLTDFGLARADDDSAHLTSEGQLLGTVAYIAPEQAADAASIGPEADIYSLGVVLFQAVTGRMPFRGTKLQILSQIATQTSPPPARFRPEIDSELENIILRAMDREPEKRFPTALAMAEALDRWAAARAHPAAAPVSTVTTAPIAQSAAAAAPPTPARKAYRPWLLASSLAVLVVGVGVSLWLSRWHDGNGDPSRPDSRTTKPGQRLLPMAWVSEPAPIDGVLGWTFATAYMPGPVKVLAYSPDGKFLAVTGEPGKIQIWEVATRRLQAIWLAEPTWHNQVKWSPDGKALAALEGANTYSVWIWEFPSGRRLSTGRIKSVASIAWSPDSTTLAVGHRDGVVKWWRRDGDDSPKPLRSPRGYDAITALAWSPDGMSLAASAGNKRWIWNLEKQTNSKPREWNPLPITAIAWSPGAGRFLALAAEDKFIRFVNMETGKDWPEAIQHVDSIRSMAWSPNGEKLVSFDGKYVMIDPVPREGSAERTWRFSFGGEALAYDFESQVLAYGKDIGTVEFVQAPTRKRLGTLPTRGKPLFFQALAWSPDGAFLAAGGADSGMIYLWDGKTGQPLRSLVHGLRRVRAVAWAGDSQTLAVSSGTEGEHEIEIWNAATGERERTVATAPGGAVTLAWSPTGRHLASAGQKVVVHDMGLGKVLPLTGPKGPFTCILWSSDGKRVAAGDRDGAIHVWDAERGNLLRNSSVSDPICSLSWSADGETLAIASMRSQVAVWKWQVDAEPTHVNGISGTLLASLGDATLVTNQGWIWHPADNRKARCFSGGESIAAAPGSKIVAVTYRDGTRVWDIDSGKMRSNLIAFAEGGMVTIGANGAYRAGKDAEKHLLVAVESNTAMDLLSLQDFAQRFRWINEPDQVRLCGE